MADKDPVSYKDPLYADLSAKVEQKLGLPVGLVRSVIQDGERTDADMVSPKGARHVGQFIPATRNSMIEKYGIDPWLNANTAVESVGLLLKENLDRAGGDVQQAVRQYHGGLDPKNWGAANNAYWGRVARGFDRTRTDALSKDFAAFMAANLAVPAASASQGAAASPMPAGSSAAPADSLSQGFGAWLQSQAAGPDQIPVEPGANTAITPEAPQSIVDRLLGLGEAGLTLATGATGGAIGAATGAAGGLARAVMDGTFGTQQGVQNIQSSAEQGAQNLTYAPRTTAGRQMAQSAGEALSSVIPVAPLTGELQALARAGSVAQPSVAVAGSSARANVGEAAQVAKSAAQAATERVAQAMGRGQQEVAPTPGTMPSIGAAGVDMANLRRQSAAELPVPVNLTRGQAERTFEQQRFEAEAAKDPTRGAPLRDRFAEQNQQILRNFDAWADQTGAEAPNLRATGAIVDNALVQKAKRDKTEVNAKYAAARRSDEAKAIVDQELPVQIGEGDNVLTKTPLGFINEQPAGLPSNALTDAARQYAVRTGVADLVDGQLVPRPGATVRDMENWRKAISEATGYDPTAIRQSTILKKLIDGQTEPLAGPLYRDARRARELYARQYENRAVISDLLRTKRGTEDRVVALEDIFDRTILRSSLDDVRFVRRVLQTGGEEGQQAWRELQGATLNYIRDEATKNVARDTRGNPVVSAAGLDRAIRNLEADGKLQFIFGKKGAEQLAAVNDLAKVVLTAPPGSVNHSNTASVLLAALDGGLISSSGIPVPVASGLRILASRIKDRRVQRRIDDALGVRRQQAPARDKKPTLH